MADGFSPSFWKRIVLSLGIPAVVMAGLVGLGRDDSPDSIYRGHRISWWLRYGGSEKEPRLLNVDDIRAMGPAGMQRLAYEVEHGRIPPGRYPPTGEIDHWRRTAIDWLRERLHRPDDGYDGRFTAFNLLRNLKAEAAPAIPALVRALEGNDAGYFTFATYALVGIGTEAQPIIRQILQGGPSRTRTHLIEGLSDYLNSDSSIKLDPSTILLIDYLVLVTKDDDLQLRFASVRGLSQCCQRFGYLPTMEPAISAAITLLSHPAGPPRHWTADLLVPFGKNAASAIPPLIELLDDPNSITAEIAVKVLLKIAPTDPRFVSRIRSLMESPNDQIREIARRTSFPGSEAPPPP